MLQKYFMKLIPGIITGVLIGCGISSTPQYLGAATIDNTTPGMAAEGNPTPFPQEAFPSPSVETTEVQSTKIYLPTIASRRMTHEYYVSPNGSSSGNGSVTYPWDIVTALNNSDLIQPGSIIWLRGGRYGRGGQTVFNSKVNGTESQPIIIRQYPGERATIDGGIIAYGDWTWFWGFEITNSSQERVRAQRPSGLNLLGRGQRAINMIIHNTGHPGIGFWEEIGDGGEIYGSIIWGTGIYEDNSNPAGSGIYAQNEDGERFISDVISFRNFTTGMKTWSEQAHGVGFSFEGNISFDNGDRNIFAGTNTYPILSLKLINNYTYRREGDWSIGTSAGYGVGKTHENLLIQNNYFVNGSRPAEHGAITVESWLSGSIIDNTFVSRDLVAAYTPPQLTGTLTWDRNSYFSPIDKFWYLYQDDSGYDYLTFNQWRSKTGFDSHSVYTPSLPNDTKIFIRTNKYEPNRSNIVIYNWTLKQSVSVDVSSILKPGDRYKLIDAQNYFVPPVASGTYSGGSLTVPMNLTEVAPILGNVTHIKNVHTAPEFAVFILIKQ